MSPRTVSLYLPFKLELALSTSPTQRNGSARHARTAARTKPPSTSGRAGCRTNAKTHGHTIGLLRAMLDANPALRGAETPRSPNASARSTKRLPPTWDGRPTTLWCGLSMGRWPVHLRRSAQIDRKQTVPPRLRRRESALQVGDPVGGSRKGKATRVRICRVSLVAGRGPLSKVPQDGLFPLSLEWSMSSSVRVASRNSQRAEGY